MAYSFGESSCGTMTLWMSASLFSGTTKEPAPVSYKVAEFKPVSNSEQCQTLPITAAHSQYARNETNYRY